MPARRLVIPAVKHPSYYHCISRVVDRRFVFGVHERDVFRKVMRQVEAFSGVRVLTWTILSNHFHLLLEIPPRPVDRMGDEEILRRCAELYAPEEMQNLEWEFENARGLGDAVHERLRDRFLRRMFDLSEFMKTLKQRFTFWFNREHGRVGTLWEARFKSVLVEGEVGSLLKVAAYVDLNPVRAGLVNDPKDYRWCGYAEAVGKVARARRGLSVVVAGAESGVGWREVGARYRKLLYGIGEETAVRKGLSRESVAKVWAEGGELNLQQLLRCRVRYFSDGLAVGGRGFVERIFALKREMFSAGRKCGERKLSGGSWGGLRALRGLRVDAVRAPDGKGAEP